MDKIKVHGIEFFAYHGVFEAEKQLGQTFIVDCDFKIDTSVIDDNIENTVHYGEVTLDIVKFCTENRYDLIETLANELTRYILLKYKLIEELTITLHKPSAPIPTSFKDVTLTVTRGWNTCYLAIGSNLGEREENLNLVSLEIEKNDSIVEIAKSSYLETAPYGVTDQPNFLNGAIKVKTLFTPKELLVFCQSIEELSGRIRKRHWGERTLDVDILMYSSEVIFTDELKVPHPEMHIRDFVLKPLCEIEPYLVHPLTRTNVKTLLENL